MAKTQFRPICPDWLWRSPETADLGEGERATLAYLLSSPFSSYSGVFELVPRLAAAEMRVSLATFDKRIRQLEQRGLVVTDKNHILVKGWFMNSSWPVFLKPRAKARVPTLRAMQKVPANLVAKWRVAAEACGVPSAILVQFLADAQMLATTGEEPLGDTSAKADQVAAADTVSTPYADGIKNNTTTTRNPKEDNQTSPTPAACVQVEVGSHLKDEGSALILNELAEPHRKTLMAATADLTSQSRQQLGDELSACLEAAAHGKRGPINSVKAWVDALAEEIRTGFCVASRGLEIARTREAEHRRQEEVERQAKHRKQQQAQQSAQTQATQDALTCCASEQREAVFAAAAAFASQSPGRPLSTEIRSQVLKGQIPGALAGVYV